MSVSAVAAAGVSGEACGIRAREWRLPYRQQRELTYCLAVGCGKKVTFKNQHIKIPPVPRPGPSSPGSGGCKGDCTLGIHDFTASTKGEGGEQISVCKNMSFGWQVLFPTDPF